MSRKIYKYHEDIFDSFQAAMNSNGTKSKYDKTQPQSLSALFNSLETSLKLKYNSVLAFESKNDNFTDFNKRLGGILGLKSVATSGRNKFIYEFNLIETVLKEIRDIIKEHYQIDYHTEYIQQMTLGSIMDLKTNHAEIKIKDNIGMAAFFKQLNPEETYLTSQFVVEMATLSNSIISKNVLDGIDPSKNYLTMIPGFDGRHEVLTKVAERLKIPALCIQLEPNCKSIYETALKVKEAMKSKYKLENKFYLLGYSFGVIICLEVAALLEKEGYTGVIYCLDSSPDALKTQLDAYLGKLSEPELLSAVLCHISRLMSGQDDDLLKQKLANMEDYDKKLRTCLESVGGKYSMEFTKDVIEGLYRKIMLVKEYDSELRVQSQVVLIASESGAGDLSSDYGLHRYCTKPVAVHQVPSDHASVPYDCRVSNIVNQYLDPEILKVYAENDACDYYYFGSES